MLKMDFNLRATTERATVDEEPQTRRLELVRRHVAIARRHVAQSQDRISAHYQRVLKLQAEGDDTHDAELLLHSLLQTHQMLRASLAVEEMMQKK